jgi:hypothetical protein
MCGVPCVGWWDEIVVGNVQVRSQRFPRFVDEFVAQLLRADTVGFGCAQDLLAHLEVYGVTNILQCRSGSARSLNAAPTSSRPTSPVMTGVTSISPSAIARSDEANSSGS